jgi:hypothetical protein
MSRQLPYGKLPALASPRFLELVSFKACSPVLAAVAVWFFASP